MLFKKAKPLKKPDDVEHAYNYVLFLLNLRLRTEGEIRKKMQTRGYISTVIDEIVQRLIQERLVDDERYAEIFIENMKSYKQYGVFQMKKKLMEKLLPKDIIENKLSELVSVSEERKIAERYVTTLVSSRVNTRQSENRGISRQARDDIRKEIKKLPYEEKQKIMRRLLSRGFRLDALGFMQ